MSNKTTSISRQQRRAERKQRRNLPAGIPAKQRETLDDVLAELDYEHIALGLEPEASPGDSHVHETPNASELVAKRKSSSVENPLDGFNLLYLAHHL